MRTKLPFETGSNDKFNKVNIKVYFDSKLTDPETIIKIEAHIIGRKPFGLIEENSIYIFVPDLTAMFIYQNRTTVFKVQHRNQLVELAAMVLLTHKIFLDHSLVQGFLDLQKVRELNSLGTVSLSRTNDPILLKDAR